MQDDIESSRVDVDNQRENKLKVKNVFGLWYMKLKGNGD